MKEITDRLEQGILGIYESDRYADYLRTMSKFHDYSLNNTILIAMQGGNLVKGYKQWEKEFDRHVKPGEKAIKILAPSPVYRQEASGKNRPATHKSLFSIRTGKPVTEEKEITDPRLSVWYLSLMYRRPRERKCPTIAVNDADGQTWNITRMFSLPLKRLPPVPVGFEKIERRRTWLLPLVRTSVLPLTRA